MIVTSRENTGREEASQPGVGGGFACAHAAALGLYLVDAAHPEKGWTRGAIARDAEPPARRAA